MATSKLTKRAIDAFWHPGAGAPRAILWDAEVPGLGVRADVRCFRRQFNNGEPRSFVKSQRSYAAFA